MVLCKSWLVGLISETRNYLLDTVVFGEWNLFGHLKVTVVISNKVSMNYVDHLRLIF